MHKLNKHEIDSIKNKQMFLIDVRTAEEVAEQGSPIAIHWDVQRMIAGDFPVVPKDKPVFVFCRSGSRSSIAQSLMLSQGFTKVQNLGGIDDIPRELRG